MLQKLANDYWLVTGTATKDAEIRSVGEKATPLCEWSVAAGKRQDTTTIFVSAKAWRRLASCASGIRKGDAVCMIGQIEEREYNGKTYSNLVCEWLNVASRPGAAGFGNSRPASDGSPQAPQPPAYSDLRDADGELPF